MSEAEAELARARRRHDLRTPMNGVLGMLELLLDTRLDARQRDYVLTARRAAQSLLARLDGAEVPEDEPEQPWAGPSLRILVAEDTEESLLVIEAMLQGDGHTVTALRDGAAALAALTADRFDAVLLDLVMPGMDGVAAARAMRALPHGGTVPILGLTASTSAQDSQECLAAGMDAVLLKPLRRGVLRAVLADLAADVAVQAAPSVLDPAWLGEMRAVLPPERVVELVRQVEANAAGYLGAIETALGEGDAAGVADAAHRLAGLAAMYGCTELRAAVAAVEDAGRDGRLGEARARLDGIGAALARALAALREAVVTA